MKKLNQFKRLQMSIPVFLFSVIFFDSAQAQPVTTPDTRYGIGGTRVTTVTDNGLGIRTTTEEYYDGKEPPKLREKVVRTKNLIEGDSTIVTTEYTKGLLVDVTFEVKINGRGEVVYTDTVHYDRGKKTVGRRHIKLPDGSWEYYEYNKDTDEFELKIGSTGHTNENASTGYLGTHNPARASIFAGYSFLSTIGEGEDLTFPAGANLAFTYYFNRSLGVMADISGHSRKDDMEKICRLNISAGLTYRFLKKDGDANVVPHLHLLAGIGRETFKIDDYKNSESGLIAALGGGADLRLSPSASLRFAADVLMNRLNDETIKNYRIAGGIVIHLSELFDE